MSVTLQPVFEALGYGDAGKQRSLVTLLHASGAFGDVPGVGGVLNDKQADAVLHHVTFDHAEQAARWLHEVTQENMLRPHGTERHQCDEPERFRQHRDELLAALRGAGMIDEVKPTQKHYDHVLLHGAMEGAVGTRLDTLKKLWDDGVRFDNIYLLGSERPLVPEHEPMAQIAKDGGAKHGTEMQMMIARIYEKSESWPEALQHVRITPVATPNKANGQRADTQDNVKSWLATNPKPGSVLAISNQPYVGHQDAALKSALPASFQAETIGAPAVGMVKIGLAMDSLARQIDAGFPKLLEKLKTQKTAPVPQLMMLDPACIKVDAPTYQFRSGGDGNGVTAKGRYHADQWDPILHGNPLLVHERLDGSMYVADGHHRLDLANKLNAEGKGPGNVAAQVLREADGYTAQDAKIIAAYKNIAHGKTDPVDTARVFKEAQSGQVHKEWLPHLQMDKGNLRMSYSLSKLSDTSLEHVAKGEVPAEMAAQVAERLPGDHGKQEEVIGLIGQKLRQPYDMRTNRPTTVQVNVFPSTEQAKAVPGFVERLQRQRMQPVQHGLVH